MSSKHIDTLEFIKDYCQTLYKDNDADYYIKIPIANYEDLSLFRSAIVNAIAHTAESHEINQQSSLPMTIHYLTHILHEVDLFSECSGLTKLLEGN